MSGPGGMVLGEDGPIWVLTGQQVATLWPLLRVGAQVLQERGRFAQVEPAMALLRTAIFVMGAADSRRAAVLHSEPPIGTSDPLARESEWMTTAAAAEALGMCRQHVSRLARSGAIPAQRVAGRG